MSPTTLPRVPRAALHRGDRIDGCTVLMAVMGFFGVVFAVNGLMLYFAISTHSGLVAQEPYRKGLAYNDRIEADARQAELGWAMSLDVATDGLMVLGFVDGDAQPVTGLAVVGRIGRPASSLGERRLVLTEREPGRYVGEVGRLEPGNWQADIDVRRGDSLTGGDQPVYRARRRLWLKP